MDQPMTPIPYEHDPDELEQALHAAQVGSATHWPTVAAILRDEVLRLRSDATTPAPDNRRWFFLLYCRECDMKIPFGDRAERDEWATRHAQAHDPEPTITCWEETVG